MKLAVILITVVCMQASAGAFAQKITLHEKNATVSKLLALIKAQSRRAFFYDNKLVKNTHPIDADVQNATLEQALNVVLKDQPLTYSIVDQTVVISKKEIYEALKITVEGVVTDEKGAPIPGVSVRAKNTAGGAITDVNGKFRLTDLVEGTNLIFSFIGYETQETGINRDGKLTIVLKQASKGLDEVVVVGYGVQKKANLTGAVSTLNFDDLGNIPQANTVNILEGRLSGVSVVQGGGQPGADQGDVIIRGIGTLNDASPLVIIDGVQSTLTDLGNIPPQDIASVSVLKDASSAAIYGSRGANGVILVATKMPKNEKVSINFNAYTALQKATYLPQMVESWQFMTLMNEAVANRYSPALIDSAKNGVFADDIANTKWFDQLFRTATMQNYNLSVSGASKGTSYMLSGGLLKQDGIMLGTSAKRYTIRGNVSTKINNSITLGLNIWGYNNDSAAPYEAPGDLIAAALHVPIMPVKYANGNYAVWNENITGNQTVENPILNSQIGFTDNSDMKMNLQPSVDIKILPGLSLRSAFTYSYDELKTDRFDPTYSYNNNYNQPAFVNALSSLTNSSTGVEQIQWQTTLNYNKTFGNHTVSALLGHEIVDNSQQFFTATGQGLPSNDLPELDNATSNFSVGGNKQEWALQSFFGRVNYDLSSKYLVELNLRADGSSRFNGAYHYSPSASVGWVVSKENFFRSLSPVVSFLKLRAGYGKLGNDRIGNYTYQQVLDLSGYYTVGGQAQTAASITSFGNPEITWEQTTTKNLGLDLGLLENRFNINFDLYNRTTNGILFQLPLPLSFGTASSPYQNIAEVSNKGFDFSAEYHNNIGKLTYNAGLNFSYNKNNIESLNGQRVIVGGDNGGTNGGLTVLQAGSPISSWFGYVADGLYTQKDEDNHYPKFNGVTVGSLKFKDINNDGVINDADRTVIGDGSTPYTFGLSGGLSYHGFDFNFLAQGIADKDIYVYDYGDRPGNGGQINFWQEWYTRSYDPVRNANGDWPKINSNSFDSAASSSFYVNNASYVRLKNIEFGYSLPKSLLRKLNIEQLRFYVSGQNVATFSSVPKNLDPERSNFQRFNRSYPQTSVYSLGVNVTF